MKKYTILLFVMLISLSVFSQKGYKKAYTIFDAQGKEIGYETLVKELSSYKVVLLGEIHNCAIVHWLEFEIARSLYDEHGKNFMMGAEMFEADNQLILDEYMQSVITYDRFEDEARLWPNYSTDYYPYLYFAKENKIPFVATNIPRRYANVVKYRGLQYLDSLSAEAKSYLPPLPITFKTDEENSMFAMMQLFSKSESNAEYMAQAQAIKDATMAWNIAKSKAKHFLHIQGNYHSDFKQGIVLYLAEYAPNLSVVTICNVRQDDISSLEDENKGRADYYIAVPTDMSVSY